MRLISSLAQILAVAVMLGCAYHWNLTAGVFATALLVLVVAVLLEPAGKAD